MCLRGFSVLPVAENATATNVFLRTGAVWVGARGPLRHSREAPEYAILDAIVGATS